MGKIYWFLGSEQFQPEALIKQAQLAEELGFDGVMMSEHFHPWVDDAGSGGYAWSILGAIAAATSHLKLMTAVTTPLWRYHPAVVAQAAATVDRLSNGRMELGVGSGEHLNEGALGYTYPAYAERAARLGEALQIMRRLLDGEKLNFAGAYYQTAAAKLYSPPLGKVPLYVAADGPKTATLAGQQAQGVITSVKVATTTRQRVLEPSQVAAAEAHRPRPVVIANRWTVRGKDSDEAWQALRPLRGLRAPSRDTATDPMVLRQEADALPREEILSKYRLVNTADDYVAAYSELITELKPDIVGIQTTSVDQLATLELVGRRALPQLRQIMNQ